MPSIRRQRADTADEDDDSPPRRRVRLSDEGRTSSDDDDDNSPRRSLARQQNPSTQGRSFISTQAEFEALIEEESDDESDKRKEARARQQFLREIEQMESLSGNQERPVGIIETVECINFMCHEHLTISLGPLINFIVGHNGSGKSAVLTALTLCLGGKATSTNRGQSLKSFVKEGKENCILIAKIKNQGASGYRVDVYGDSIIVERHFSISGSSSFKIKSANGRVISTKRAELDEITDFYALQLDNPVNVLTQDMARQFLNSSSPLEKYKFFVRGVQLEQLHNDYSIVYETLSNTNAQLVNVQETCKALEKTMVDARARFDRVAKQDSLRDKIAKLDRQHAWAQVEELERGLENLKQKVAVAQEKVENRQEAVICRSELYDGENGAHADAKEACEQTRAELPEVEEKYTEARQTFDKVTKELQEYHTAQKGIHGSVQACKQSIENITKDITTERNRLAAMDDGSHANMVRAVEDAELELQNAREARDRHPQEKPQLDQELRTAELRASDIKKAAERKKEELHQARNRLESLEKDRPNPMRGYHGSLTKLRDLINRNRSNFHHQPVGPIGMHIKLNKPHWSPILEKFFGAQLNHFVVSTKHDEQLLTTLVRQANYRCSVIIVKPARIETRACEPNVDLDTIMRVTTIENDLVRNALIIQQQIERVVLTQQRKDALDLMTNGDKIHMCLCFRDGDRRNGHLIAKGAGGNTKMDPINADGNAPRMVTDNQAQIEMQRDNVLTTSQQTKEMEDEYTAAKTAVNKCNQALKRYTNRLRDLRAAADKAVEQHEDARMALETATATDSPLDALKEQLEEQETDRENYLAQYTASKEGMEELGRKNKENKRILDDHVSRLTQLRGRINEAERAIVGAGNRRETALRKKNEAVAAVTDAEIQKAEAESHVTQMEKHITDFAAEASKICERVPVDSGMTPNQLDKKLVELRKQAREAEREAGGTRDELSKAALDARTRFDNIENEYKTLCRIGDRLHESMNERSHRWRSFRANIVARARTMFQYLLSEREFNGQLEFHHNQRELELKVQPEARGGTKEGRQTKTLSGGEKSFSTICLLLSLWDAMGSPIRCLDEFDVFMDSVNRDISMRMIIAASRRSVGRQYILITPQSMGSVDQGKDIRVTLMREPERGQQTLEAVG